MERESGEKTFPIWLLGDSEPARWKDRIKYPLDERHPIRHNIWTSIIDKIQEGMFLYNKSRIDTNKIFIRNAVNNPELKPRPSDANWTGRIDLELNLKDYRNLIKEYSPKLILSFGSFAFEFGRRCMDESPQYPFNHWGAIILGTEFRKRISNKDDTLLLPLLHRSIAGGKFIESHEYFCDLSGANYFKYISENLIPILKYYNNILIS